MGCDTQASTTDAAEIAASSSNGTCARRPYQKPALEKYGIDPMTQEGTSTADDLDSTAS
jgi:hypothetical protein